MRSVGVGGFARVYHAVDPDLELDVAIKVLRPELAHDAEIVERFRREATTVARLRHPHVITVLTVGRLADPFDGLPVGAPYLVMDYLPHSLADRLNEGGALPQDDVARIGAEVARGLAYAHRQGIVHRDVKPENVLFARDGRAVVTDFGIARALSAAPSGPSRQVLLGTPAYFSPEQARGLALDGRSDLYSLAVTLYRAATGVVPFAGDDWYVVMRQHVEETAVPPSSVNPDLNAAFDAVLARALAKDPAARYQTGDALADALDALRGGATSTRHSTTEIPRVAAAAPPRARASRWRWTGAALAAAGIAAVAGRVLAVRGSPERVSLVAPAATPTLPPESAVAGALPGEVSANAPVARTTPGPVRDDVTARPAGAAGDLTGSLDSAPRGDSGRFGRGVGAATGFAASSVGAGGRVPRTANPTSPAARNLAGARGTTAGTLSVSVPGDAEVFLDGDPVGRGPWRSGTVSPGRYTIRASLGGLPGCSSADTVVTVDVAPGARRAVTLEPIPCGRLMLEFAATSTPHYTLVRAGGGATRQGVLPLSEPLILPDGTYRLTVEASACASYSDDRLPVVAGTTRREPLHKLLCQ